MISGEKTARSSDCAGRRKQPGDGSYRRWEPLDGKEPGSDEDSAPLVIGGLSTNERRRTTTAMQNFLTFKFSRTAASEVGTARRGSSFYGLTRGRWQPLVRNSKFGRRRQLPQSKGAADERSKTNSHHDADAYFNDYSDFTYKDDVLGGGSRSTEFFVSGTHSTDLEAKVNIGIRRRAAGGISRRTRGS